MPNLQISQSVSQVSWSSLPRWHNLKIIGKLISCQFAGKFTSVPSVGPSLIAFLCSKCWDLGASLWPTLRSFIWTDSGSGMRIPPPNRRHMNQTIKLTRPEKHTQPTTFANENQRKTFGGRGAFGFIEALWNLERRKMLFVFQDELQQWQQPRV